MKERLLKVLKWFFITLGVIFFIQILIVLCIALCFKTLTRPTFGKIKDVSYSKNNIKQIQPIIKYAEDYYLKNNKYPEKIGEEVKIDKKFNYSYEVSKTNNCYTIIVSPLDKNKQTFAKEKTKGTIKQYQHCKMDTENSSMNSENYSEFTY